MVEKIAAADVLLEDDLGAAAVVIAAVAIVAAAVNAGVAAAAAAMAAVVAAAVDDRPGDAPKVERAHESLCHEDQMVAAGSDSGPPENVSY